MRISLPQAQNLFSVRLKLYFYNLYRMVQDVSKNQLQKYFMITVTSCEALKMSEYLDRVHDKL